MNLEPIVSKQTAFYYWVQLMANWNPCDITAHAYEHYGSCVKLSSGNRETLKEISDIYKGSSRPLDISYALYTGDDSNNEADVVRCLARGLVDAYEPIWNSDAGDIMNLKEFIINSVIPDEITPVLKRLNNFFGTSIDLARKYRVYILPNTPGVGGSSLGRSGANDTIMVVSTRKPKIISRFASNEKIMLTICHEYCHAFAKNSGKLSGLIEEAFPDKYPGLVGFTLAGFVKESITRAIAQPDYDSLLAPFCSRERHNKPIDDVVSMAKSPSQSVTKSHAACTLLSLDLLPIMRKYIESGKPIDDNFIKTITSHSGLLRRCTID